MTACLIKSDCKTFISNHSTLNVQFSHHLLLACPVTISGINDLGSKYGDDLQFKVKTVYRITFIEL